MIRDWPPAVALIAMIKTLAAEERLQSRREEIANSVSSGVGLIAVIGGIPFLLGSAIRHGSELSLAGVIIFAATMVSLYLTSTIYHALPRTKIKRLFRLFDHRYDQAPVQCHSNTEIDTLVIADGVAFH